MAACSVQAAVSEVTAVLVRVRLARDVHGAWVARRLQAKGVAVDVFRRWVRARVEFNDPRAPRAVSLRTPLTVLRVREVGPEGCYALRCADGQEDIGCEVTGRPAPTFVVRARVDLALLAGIVLEVQRSGLCGCCTGSPRPAERFEIEGWAAVQSALTGDGRGLDVYSTWSCADRRTDAVQEINIAEKHEQRHR